MLLGFPDYIEIKCSGNIPHLQFTIIERKVKPLNASGKTLGGGILSKEPGHTEQQALKIQQSQTLGQHPYLTYVQEHAVRQINFA